MKMNLPNKLTVLRLILVPFFIVILMASDALWASIVGLVLFVGAAFTDMLDGKIARKNNLVTDFGKFLDPLADKFMVIGAMLIILYRFMTAPVPNRFLCNLFFWAVMIVIFRELAVTSIRLVASGSKGVVIAANMLGKIKTVTQIICVCACIAEPILGTYIPVLDFLAKYVPITIASTVIMLIFTLWSGINYIVSYWKFLDPEK
jgi:CDP-diacylglycerol--glycerol-3-phosphate 3-phosphatidyltransferase